MSKRTLSREEIQELANRPSVKSRAVENFLGTLPPHTTEEEDMLNLKMDAVSYGWNVATRKEIQRGLTLAHGGK